MLKPILCFFKFNFKLYLAFPFVFYNNLFGKDSIKSNPSYEEFRETVRRERRIEFAGEGLYYMDIIRWEVAEIVLNLPELGIDGNIVETRSFDPQHDYLWPLPDREILLNPNLEQNPGY